jgi:hypothetical protein
MMVRCRQLCMMVPFLLAMLFPACSSDESPTEDTLEEKFIVQYSKLSCERLEYCCDKGKNFTNQNCHQKIRSELESLFAENAKNNVKMNEDGVKTCLDNWKDYLDEQACRSFEINIRQCHELFRSETPTKNIGDDCNVTAECKPIFDTKVVCVGYCKKQLPPIEGGPCGAGNYPCETAPGWFCDETNNSCERKRQLGDHCDSSIACGDGLLCSENQCIKGLKVGEACHKKEELCLGGTFCHQHYKVCWVQEPIGMPCTKASECKSFYCSPETERCSVASNEYCGD